MLVEVVEHQELHQKVVVLVELDELVVEVEPVVIIIHIVILMSLLFQILLLGLMQ